MIASYKTVSNAFFDTSKKVIAYLESHQWVEKIAGAQEEDVQKINAQAKQVVDWFHTDIDVNIDYISDMDLILTHTAYQVDNMSTETVEKKPDHKSPSAR
ncbi:MAG: hypothetical protein R3A45_08535 [Bdellovibrionota bacterium]